MQIFNMGDNSKRQPLPLVELRPFSKRVWRREKSLPDFYEKVSDDPSKVTNKEKKSEITPVTAQMLKEIEASRRPVETRQGPSVDYQLGKIRCHPKAEFSNECRKGWRTQDILPGFVTRLERTKTTLESFGRESELRLPLENCTSQEENAQMFPTNMVVRGGRMQQKIYRRHMLYLNPLHTYRHPDSLPSAFNGSNISSLTNSREKSMATRHSFPLSSSRAAELLLNGSTHNNYPLRPIRHEHAPSPHKFNSKLGAAKNSLHVMSQWGAPTKLEKNLEMEFEMNLDRFRRDRLLLPFDLRNSQSQYVSFNTNLTRGEANLKEAREANKPRKKIGFSSSVTHKDMQSSPGNENSESHRENPAEIDAVRHPVNHVLPEESESCAMQGSDVDEIVESRPPVTLSSCLKTSEGIENQMSSRNSQVQFSSDKQPVSTFGFESGDINSETGRGNKSKTSLTGRSRSFENLTSNISPSSQSQRNLAGHSEQFDRETDLSPGSLTARAKTNLEYLHNLRTKGALPPLQSREPSAILSENKSDMLNALPQPEVSTNIGELRHDGKLPEPSSGLYQNKCINDVVTSCESEKLSQFQGRENGEHPASVHSPGVKSDAETFNSDSLNKHYPTYLKSGVNPSVVNNNVKIYKENGENNVVKTTNGAIENEIQSLDEVTDSATSAIAQSTHPQGSIVQLTSVGNSTDFKDTLEDNISIENPDAKINGNSNRIQNNNGNKTSDDFQTNNMAPCNSSLENKPKDPDSSEMTSKDNVCYTAVTENVDRVYKMDCDSLGGEESSVTPNHQIVEATESFIRRLVVGDDTKSNLLHKDQPSMVYPVITACTEDETLSLVTPLPTLDASVSDTEGILSCSADNGDSGVSTTFLTTSDTVAAQIV